MTTGVISIGDGPPCVASQQERRKFRVRLPHIPASLVKPVFKARAERGQLISASSNSPEEQVRWTSFPSTLTKLSGSRRFRRWLERAHKS